MNLFLTCEVCGYTFAPGRGNHYLARGNTSKGIAAAMGSTPEPQIYDAYDCPRCASQIIAQ